MRRTLWVALGALLAAAPGLQARQHSRAPDPADPSVAVPPARYVSAMTGYTPALKDNAPPPDKAWRGANDAVGGHGDQGGHAGHAAHAGHANQAPKPASTQAPSRPVPAPAEHHQHH